MFRPEVMGSVAPRMGPSWTTLWASGRGSTIFHVFADQRGRRQAFSIKRFQPAATPDALHEYGLERSSGERGAVASSGARAFLGNGILAGVVSSASFFAGIRLRYRNAGAAAFAANGAVLRTAARYLRHSFGSTESRPTTLNRRLAMKLRWFLKFWLPVVAWMVFVFIGSTDLMSAGLPRGSLLRFCAGFSRRYRCDCGLD